MISVCIPAYNYYVYPLVRRLVNQAKNLTEEVEVVCIDDHSSDFYERQNRGVGEIATYVRLAQNIGRSRIRNLFLKYAKGDYLLFLDNDSQVPDNFLKTYIKQLPANPSVVVGGRIYDNRANDQHHRLRYLYGTRVESRPADYRRKHPYQSFMTNNFLIRRDVLQSIPFDRSITKYGHEDTLFGYRLEQNKVPVAHIDNPVVNGQVEDNAEFLHKTVEAVENLAMLYDRMWEDQKFCHSVRLIRVYEKLRHLRLHRLVYSLFKLMRSPMESHFVQGSAVSLTQFNFYKLGMFIKKINYPTTNEQS